MYDLSDMICLHTAHSSSLPAVLDGPGGGGGSVLEVYMSKCVKEILNFIYYVYNNAFRSEVQCQCSHSPIYLTCYMQE